MIGPLGWSGWSQETDTAALEIADACIRSGGEEGTVIKNIVISLNHIRFKVLRLSLVYEDSDNHSEGTLNQLIADKRVA